MGFEKINVKTVSALIKNLVKIPFPEHSLSIETYEFIEKECGCDISYGSTNFTDIEESQECSMRPSVFTFHINFRNENKNISFVFLEDNFVRVELENNPKVFASAAYTLGIMSLNTRTYPRDNDLPITWQKAYTYICELSEYLKLQRVPDLQERI